MSFLPYEERSSHSLKNNNTIKTPEGVTNEFYKNPEGFHYINMLSTENSPTFTIFRATR
ncbi:unnamed protein product [Meloidogyne enterolobii]|uniref:Uncharacterized protein n=1 Tax=Meloidogyne enterolobii TaxID=390850 RepID=A0ACB0Z4I0_MELEN